MSAPDVAPPAQKQTQKRKMSSTVASTGFAEMSNVFDASVRFCWLMSSVIFVRGGMYVTIPVIQKRRVT